MNEWLERYSRREFIGVAATAAAVAMLPAGCKSGISRAREAGGRKLAKSSLESGLFAAIGDDPYKMTLEAVKAAGGMKALVKKGDTVVIKPNIAWDRTPEQAANTNPSVVRALVEMCREAEAGQVYVFDRPCNEARRTYARSGIAEAAKVAGAKVPFVNDEDLVKINIPDGKTLKKCFVHRMILEADVFINVPIVKHHSATVLTAGLKNMMGCMGGNRGMWHVGGLNQRIADINTAIPADLTVMDAFRIIVRNGPTGGSLEDVREANTVAVGTDRVAADAYAATVFGVEPGEVESIRLAAEMGQGEIDLAKVEINEFEI
ncbi:MAG: DUF362 domain-containing protein [bacterium]